MLLPKINIILNDERLRIKTHQPTTQSTQRSTQFVLWIETVKSKCEHDSNPAYTCLWVRVQLCVCVCVCAHIWAHTRWISNGRASPRLPDFKRRVEGRKRIMGILDYHVQSLGYVVTCNTLCVYVAWRVLALRRRGNRNETGTSITHQKQRRGGKVATDDWHLSDSNNKLGSWNVLCADPTWIRGWWKADGFICWSQTPREVFDSLKWNVA